MLLILMLLMLMPLSQLLPLLMLLLLLLLLLQLLTPMLLLLRPPLLLLPQLLTPMLLPTHMLLTTPDVSTVSDQLCLVLRTRTETLIKLKTEDHNQVEPDKRQGTQDKTEKIQIVRSCRTESHSIILRISQFII